jgi:hypothetical protein
MTGDVVWTIWCMEKFKTIKELYEFYEYLPPEGGMEYLTNIDCIFRYLLEKSPSTNIELTRKEFSNFMAVFNNEVCTAILLDKRNLQVNQILIEGFDFRGIKVRVK